MLSPSWAIFLPSSSQWVLKLQYSVSIDWRNPNLYCIRISMLRIRYQCFVLDIVSSIRIKHGSLQYSEGQVAKGVNCLVVQPRDSHRSKPSILLPPQSYWHRCSHIRVGQAIVSFLIPVHTSTVWFVEAELHAIVAHDNWDTWNGVRTYS